MLHLKRHLSFGNSEPPFPGETPTFVSSTSMPSHDPRFLPSAQPTDVESAPPVDNIRVVASSPTKWYSSQLVRGLSAQAEAAASRVDPTTLIGTTTPSQRLEIYSKALHVRQLAQFHQRSEATGSNFGEAATLPPPPTGLGTVFYPQTARTSSDTAPVSTGQGSSSAASAAHVRERSPSPPTAGIAVDFGSEWDPDLRELIDALGPSPRPLAPVYGSWLDDGSVPPVL